MIYYGVDQIKVDYDDKAASTVIKDELARYICQAIGYGKKHIVFVCIGTDRSTGDSLGPLVGDRISIIKSDNVSIFGTLEEPVHAQNLDQVHQAISEIDDPFVVAIDACLGLKESVGHISIGKGGLKPGLGVGKDLTVIGDIYITAVVNVGGFMEFAVLQGTRLSVIMKMAKVITYGIRGALFDLKKAGLYERISG